MDQNAKQRKQNYDNQYIKTHYKRISLNIPFAYYERLQSAATGKGESVTEYIKEAIRQRIDSESENT